MGWLWESEREEGPRRSGLKLIALGGFAAVAGAAGFFLIGSKEPNLAVAPAVMQLDCTSPRNAWRAACRPATAEASAPALSEAVEEGPKATGAIPPKEAAKTAPARTARASSKSAKPDVAVPEAVQKPVDEASRAEPEEQLPPARTTAALDNPPSEPPIVRKASAPPQAVPERIERAPRREPAAERTAEGPAKLVRHRAKPVVAAGAERSRPAPQAMKSAPETRLARPRVRDTGDAFARFRQPGTETVALPDGRRVFVERSPREAFAGGRDAYRASQWKVTTYRDPIDW